MSLIVRGIRLPLDEDEGEAIAAALKKCGLAHPPEGAAIYKKSIDLRRGGVSQVFSVLLELPPQQEDRLIQKNHPDIVKKAPLVYPAPQGKKPSVYPPVVIGFGPAGIFAALMLAKNGYRPVVFEKGPAIDERDRKIETFCRTGVLDERANIQFGEGGAGTYSDGKLTTRIHDLRCELVLSELYRHGAPEEVRTSARPHIGSDRLRAVIESIRREILSLGGIIRFDTEIDGFDIKAGRLRAVCAGSERIPCRFAVFAGGHSARSTFKLFCGLGVSLERKPFSVGVRVEHLQRDIDAAVYGRFAGHEKLPPAEYALSHKCRNGRGAYSFCMCPGGTVVAAASERGGIVVNGMSLHARAGENANAAIAVGVTPDDFDGHEPLSGVEFQRKIERAAYRYTGSFKAPAQRLGDFLSGKGSAGFSKVRPSYPMGVVPAEIGRILPPFVTESLFEAFCVFGQRLRGFDDADAVLTAPETRTSSPVRVLRRQSLESPDAEGLIPCGEGAGYAGGIMSAAVDGIRAAERIMYEYVPF